MQVADEATKGNVIGESLNLKRGFGWIGNVVKHFQNASDAEDEHEEDGCATCA